MDWNELTPLALHGNVRAQALLGFMYENGFGAPQAYEAAADLYGHAAVRWNPFAQAMLGLLYDKGHGVPQDFVLAYKWLNLAAARAPKRERDYYARLRNAVASKMSADQIVVGQRLGILHVDPVFLVIAEAKVAGGPARRTPWITMSWNSGPRFSSATHTRPQHRGIRSGISFRFHHSTLPPGRDDHFVAVVRRLFARGRAHTPSSGSLAGIRQPPAALLRVGGAHA